jgi:hypothetical protein
LRKVSVVIHQLLSLWRALPKQTLVKGHAKKIDIMGQSIHQSSRLFWIASLILKRPWRLSIFPITT